jgi:small subunit ribosomal protein S20
VRLYDFKEEGRSMANIKSAEKRIERSAKERARNRAQRSQMRGAMRDVRQAVEDGDQAKAQELLPGTIKLVDVTARKKVIHRNAAARTKSRLTRAVAKMKD